MDFEPSQDESFNEALSRSRVEKFVPRSLPPTMQSVSLSLSDNKSTWSPSQTAGDEAVYFGGCVNAMRSETGNPYLTSAAPTQLQYAASEGFSNVYVASDDCEENVYASTGDCTRSINPFAPRKMPARPLRLIHVGPCFLSGGVEQHTMSLARFLDPRFVRFEKCLVTNPAQLSKEVAAAMPVPVEHCDPSNIQEAVADCDVVLLWGGGISSMLKPSQSQLNVFVAHGESWWTG